MLDSLMERLEKNEASVCIVGTGYVGLPLAVEFALSGLKVRGFDLNREKVGQLSKGTDVTGEVSSERLKEALGKGLEFTSEESEIKGSDFFILCVPTPVGRNKEPDLSYVKSAGEVAGRNLKRGSVVVLESTVYPGATEEVLKPVLERESGLACGRDFFLGYSPERVNPGDKEHGLENVVKVVAGSSEEVADVLEKLYSRVTKAGVFRAKDIKTAEAAKVIENIQRDLNIALINELSMIFRRMGIDTEEVLKAAETKWNFHSYRPGMVGGHCIPVDPYYLVHRAREIGYEPKVILAGREINDSMPEYVERLVEEEVRKQGKNPRDCRVLILGLSFKRNVRDTRNSPVKRLAALLRERGFSVAVHDPLVGKECAEREFDAEYAESIDDGRFDCAVIATDHDVFRKTVDAEKLKRILGEKGIVVDARRMLSPESVRKEGLVYVSL